MTLDLTSEERAGFEPTTDSSPATLFKSATHTNVSRSMPVFNEVCRNLNPYRAVLVRRFELPLVRV